jgi:hypothetical protein
MLAISVEYLSVIMLNVIILNIVTPKLDKKFNSTIEKSCKKKVQCGKIAAIFVARWLNAYAECHYAEYHLQLVSQ